MSEQLHQSKDGVSLTRFWGGEQRGTCYQITDRDGVYVQLTRSQFDEVLAFCIGSVDGPEFKRDDFPLVFKEIELWR